MSQLTLMLYQVKLLEWHAARFEALFDRNAHIRRVLRHHLDSYAAGYGPEAAARRQRDFLDALQRLQHIAREDPAAIILDSQAQLAQQVARRGHVAQRACQWAVERLHGILGIVAQ